MGRAFTSSAVYLGGGFLLAAALLLFDAGTGSATAPRWMAIYAGAIGALIWLGCQKHVQLDRIDILAIAFLAWAALSLLWSPDWKAGVLHWQNMASLFAIALLVRHAKVFDGMLPIVLAVSILAAVGLGVWWPEVHGGFGNENFIAEFILIGGALLVVLDYKWEWLDNLTTLTVIAALVYLFFFNDSHSQYLAAVAALGLLGWQCWRHQYYVMFGALVVCMGVVGLAIALYGGHLDAATQSLTERAEIWVNTAYMITQNPAWGHGLGSFDYVYPRSEHIALLGERTFLTSPTDYVGAAHNDYLQLIAELGFIGLALAGLLVWQIFKWCEGPGRFAIFIVAVLCLVGFPLQSPASAVCASLALGLAARGRVWRYLPAASGNLGGLLALPLAVSAFLFYSGHMQSKAVYQLINVSPVHALQAQLNALETYDLDPWLRLQASLTLATVLRTYKPAQVDLSSEAADRIYDISRSAVPEHPGVLITRIEYLMNSGRYGDEIDDTLAMLKKRGPFYAETWALEALYAGYREDEPRMQHAVLTAFNLPNGREVFMRLGLLRAS